MKVRESATGAEIDIPDAAAGEFAARGQYDFAPGSAIPVKHDDGSVSSVPIEQYWQQRALYQPATQADVNEHLAKQQVAAAEAESARLDQEYGEGAANVARAGIEGAARGISLGASDWVATQLGADAEGLKQRAERNPIAAFAGEAAGAIAPLVLTGGMSALEQAGLKGAATLAARATPTAIADAIGAAAGRKVAAAVGEGFTARLAAGSANMAAQGALAGIGGEISDRALNGQALLDPGTMDEYLLAAGQGGMIGGVFGAGGHLIGEGIGAGLKLGGKAVDLGRDLYGKAKAMAEAPLREAEAGLAAAHGADYDLGVRAAEQRMHALQPEDLSPLEAQTATARAKVEAAAPTGEVLPGAKGMRADSPLAAVGAKVRAEAEALGVPREAADSAWQRVEKGKQAFDEIDASHDVATRKIAELGDELEKISSDMLEQVDMSRRNDSLRKALATDRTAAPPEQFVDAMRQQHARIRAELAEFATDPDSQIQSYARKLNKYLERNEGELAALPAAELATRSDAFEILDQSNRILGKVRAKLGDRSSMGIGTMSEKLAGLYEETRQLLKNPNVVGEGVAGISGRAKASWSDLFDVWGGYKRGLLAEDAGGARTLTGFDTVDRCDPRKVSALLKQIDSPDAQLQLELIGRGLDSKAKLLRHFADDLGVGGDVPAQIARYQKISEGIADEIVAYRSKAALAKEYATATAPALKEMTDLEGKLATARERATEKLEGQRAKAVEKLEAERARAGDVKERSIAKAQEKLTATREKLEGGIGASILDGVLSAAGMGLGGVGGMLGAHVAARALSSMAMPVLRQLGAAGLQGAIRTGETMAKLQKIADVGRKVQQATVAIGDVLRTAKPLSGAAKVIAMEARRDTSQAYDAAVADVKARAETDPRAAYLAALLPEERRPVQMRPDLDMLAVVDPIQQRKFLRSVRAVNDPASVIRAFASGAGTREGAAALRQVYPALYQRAVSDIMTHTAALTRSPSMSAQRHLSILVGQPLHFTVSPDFVKFTQGAYGGAAAAGQSNTDMLQDSVPTARARQINSKTVPAMATPGQRLEGGVGQ